jgi:hypothetical protein
MRGFFLPQPAIWPGTPFAVLRMTDVQNGNDFLIDGKKE